MPEPLVEVFRASNDRDGKVRLYTIDALPDGVHYRHTITVQGGRSLWIDLPHWVQLVKHDKLLAHLDSKDYEVEGHHRRPWRIEYEDAEGVTQVDRTYETEEHAALALALRQYENPAVILTIRKHVEFDAAS